MYRQGKYKKSIKTKVIFLVTAIIAVILGIAISFTLYISITNLQEKTHIDLKHKSEYLANEISQRLEFLQENTEHLGANELIVNAFIDEDDRDKYLLPLVSSFKKGKFLNSLSVVDFDGRVIFQTDYNTPKFDESNELRLSLNLGETVTYFRAKQNEVVFIVPVKYYTTTQGAIIASYDMQKIISKYDNYEDFIYTKFFNRSSEFYSKNFAPKNDYYSYSLQYSTKNKILKELDIRLEMGILNSEYLKPLKKHALLLGVSSFFILIIGVLISYYLASTITEPILKLYNKVKNRTPKEQREGYEPLGTEDELEILGYAFYNKAKQLDELNRSLDTKVKDATKELEDEKTRFLLAIEGAKDGLWDWNMRTDELLFSDRFETMLGYDVGELPRKIDAWFNLLHPDDKENATKVVQDYLDKKGKESYENTFRLRRKDGSWCWILGRGKAQFDKNGTPVRFVGFNTDISQQMEYQDKLDHTAKHDSLTHLPNRFLLSELLTHAMHRVKRNKKHLALLFIDLDGFKEINDEYGHEAGDEVLSTLASRMSDAVRSSDIVSRLGGDEFVIVISDLKKNSEVIPMLQRLLSDLSADILYQNEKMSVSASIGVSFYPQIDDIGNEALIRQADQAMYTAKLLGKNQYQFFNLEASQELKEQQQDVMALRNAIQKSEFVLYYQPKVDMVSNKVIGLEVLLRWNHPEEGLLFPDSFLSLVEHESSFMIDLGQWVFKNAFAQLEFWHLNGLDVSLSINVSSYEVQHEGFIERLKKLFEKHSDIKPNSIEIELLETVAFDNFEHTSRTLRECQELGVSVAIDDFGTGYASLNYLKKLPMNTLKIDKSFVIDLLKDGSSLSIVEASIGLAHAFGCQVVAEGVESEEHGEMLLKLGCEIAQGYAISKAIPANEVMEWIGSWRGFESWKETPPIDENTRAVLYASVEHRNWIDSIERYIKNETSELPQLNEFNCHLGDWIQHHASQKHRERPEFEELNVLHSDLHKYALELLKQDENQREKGIEELEKMRSEILDKLNKLVAV